jgi:2-polyprenyl-6-methoxyphenol hydroxylase-like FAD-dependent oxidoreductase
VRVREGAPEFGAIGFGIQFGPNVFHVLDRIGVSDAVLEKGESARYRLRVGTRTASQR